jgi:PKHD-type hydroxylase
MIACLGGAVPTERVAEVFASLSAPERRGDVKRATLQVLDSIRGNVEFQTTTYPAAFSGAALHIHKSGRPGGEIAVPPISSMRSDIGVAVNLNDESEYEGGELVLDVGGLEKTCRGAAGDCFTFPADGRGRILPVTRGQRLLLTFHVQSFVRQAARRYVLSDFAKVLRSLDGRGGAHVALFRRTYENLLRRWAEDAPAAVA